MLLTIKADLPNNGISCSGLCYTAAVHHSAQAEKRAARGFEDDGSTLMQLSEAKGVLRDPVLQGVIPSRIFSITYSLCNLCKEFNWSRQSIQGQ